MKQSQFYYLLRRGLFSAGSAIIKNGLVMFNKFTTAGISHPAQGSAEFDGSSDYIQIKDDGKGSEFDTQTFTISAWVYVDELTGYNPIVWSYDHSSHTPPYYAQNFRIESDGAIFFGFNISGTYDNIISATGVVQPKTWNFISITFTSGSQKIYLNGSEVASKTISGLITYYNQAVRIGRSVFASYMFGNLANVAFWNRALSSDEINSVMWKSYEGLTGAESNGLKAWYSLDDITSPAASLANMEQLATDKDATIENKAAITAAVNALS
jgi:hypothetical protein